MEGQPTILIAEDSTQDLQILQAALNSLGYQVIACKNGADAWEALVTNKDKIIAAFVDLVMPVMDGFELIEMIRSDVFLRNLPIVVTTSHTQQDFVLKTTRLKVNGFMVKPINIQKLQFHLGNLQQQGIDGIQFKKDEIIFNIGDPSDCLYRVDEGYIGIFKMDDNDNQKLIGYVSPGEYMGEMSLLSEAPHSSRAVAMTNVVVTGYTRDEFEGMLEKTPMQVTRLLTDLISRLGKSNETIRKNGLQGNKNEEFEKIIEEYNSCHLAENEEDAQTDVAEIIDMTKPIDESCLAELNELAELADSDEEQQAS